MGENILQIFGQNLPCKMDISKILITLLHSNIDLIQVECNILLQPMATVFKAPVANLLSFRREKCGKT